MRPSEFERFWNRICFSPGGCWEWSGPLDKDGYGQFWVRCRRVRAHRYSYRLVNGYIGGACVLHTCDNRKCVNPKHLFLGTRAENTVDAAQKGKLSRKLTEQDVRNIRERYARGGVSQPELAREYKVRLYSIWSVLHRLTWKHVL